MDSLWDWAIIPGWLGEDVAEHRRRMAELDRRFRSPGVPPVLVATAALFTGECARRDGRWRTAEALFTEAVEVSGACGVGAGQVLVRLAVQAAHRGDADRGLDLVRSARAAFDHAGQVAWESQWLEHCVGVLAVASGQIDSAVAAFRGVAHAPFVGRGCRDAMALSAFELVEVLSGAGRPEESAAELSRLEARLDSIVDPFGLALVHRSRGLLHSDLDAAVAEFEAALDLHAVSDEPFHRARTQLLLGERLRRHARPKAARGPLRSAYDTFADLGATGWATRARLELRASGERVEPDRESTSAHLTPQEMRVALAVRDGMSNAEVAGALFLSVKTVEFHLSRVYRKLGVRSRTGLHHAIE